MPAGTSAEGSLPRFERSVSMLSWAYNEEGIIEDFLRRAATLMDACVEDWEIVIVDDGSTDTTNQIIRRVSLEIPRIRLITNETNRNVGYSSRRAIAEARKEYLFWQTTDWSYDISNLRACLEMLRGCDVVAGVRRAPVRCVKVFKPIIFLMRLLGVKHLSRRSDTVNKAFVSVVNYMLIRALFGIPLSDYQNVVFYPTRLIQSIKTEADSSFANPEMLFKSYWGGATIAEAPINFIPRQAGEAKGTRLKSIFRSIADILKFWCSWVLLGKIRRDNPGVIIRLRPDLWPPAEETADTCAPGER